jgi:hypothetical protein
MLTLWCNRGLISQWLCTRHHFAEDSGNRGLEWPLSLLHIRRTRHFRALSGRIRSWGQNPVYQGGPLDLGHSMSSLVWWNGQDLDGTIWAASPRPADPQNNRTETISRCVSISISILYVPMSMMINVNPLFLNQSCFL